tara:strand:+ start:2379 stop:2624 length:246 start_codon:yes stop_codon:yes gene_type:complete
MGIEEIQEKRDYKLFKINDYQILSAKEISMMTGLDVQTVYNMFNSGEFVKTKMGSTRIGMTFKNFKNWVDSNTQPPKLKLN